MEGALKGEEEDRGLPLMGVLSSDFLPWRQRERAKGGPGRAMVGPASQDKCIFLSSSSSVVHVPGVNDIQSSSSTGQNMSQISRQLNQSQVAWTGSRPPFPGQQIPSQSSKTQSPFGIGTSHTYPADPSSYSPLSSPATSSPSGNAYSGLANRTPGFGRWGMREGIPGRATEMLCEHPESGPEPQAPRILGQSLEDSKRLFSLALRRPVVFLRDWLLRPWLCGMRLSFSGPWDYIPLR
ncbi:hypothetical protein HPG69_017819 [Diceros bicornis minor]|uniref:Uncharacterized protein n=1 Tax=Diceros bicornis minor TaxID=77932 RepID=A0A7J7FGX6_DICBM|nr:hypothetical protein HPG69_017819 [Diceros bicornis minor]